jgi:hypothetical protein
MEDIYLVITTKNTSGTKPLYSGTYYDCCKYIASMYWIKMFDPLIIHEREYTQTKNAM